MSPKKSDTTTEEKILSAAVYEFAEHGYHGSRIDNIAKRGKINKAMIYYHYKGKEALYEHVLASTVSGIYDTVAGLLPETPPEQNDLEELIRGYSNHLATIEGERIRIMIREIASGGKYFRKITVPKLIAPVLASVVKMFDEGKKSGIFRDIDSLYSIIPVIGSIVFFNILRVAMKDTPLSDVLFKENASVDYTENLIKILRSGLFAEVGK